MRQLERLWEEIRAKSALKSEEALHEAFSRWPRHEFLHHVHLGGHWVSREEVAASQALLNDAYRDKPQLIYSDEHSGLWSTISQPSLVIEMIDMLDLKPGQSVFELGTGSGWSAALMSSIVGPNGRVVTTEIIGDLAKQAETFFAQNNVFQVTCLQASGEYGCRQFSPYDAVVYTVRGQSVPAALQEQLKEGGRCLAVLPEDDFSDRLVLMFKKNRKLVPSRSQSCRFLPMTYDRQPSRGEIAAAHELGRV